MKRKKRRTVKPKKVSLRQRIKSYPERMFEKSNAKRFVVDTAKYEKREIMLDDYDEAIATSQIWKFFWGFLNPDIFWSKLTRERQESYIGGYKEYAKKYRISFLIALVIGFLLAACILISSFYLMKFCGIIV